MAPRRSGLQQDVINLYKRGLKMAYSKPAGARPSFLMHMRYNFRNPALTSRDVGAIEHQLRTMTRSIESLESASVQKMAVPETWTSWWQDHIQQNRSRTDTPTVGKEDGSDEGSHRRSATNRGDTSKGNAQWGSTLPGHGGT